MKTNRRNRVNDADGVETEFQGFDEKMPVEEQGDILTITFHPCDHHLGPLRRFRWSSHECEVLILPFNAKSEVYRIITGKTHDGLDDPVYR